MADVPEWVHRLLDAKAQYERERDRHEKLARRVAEIAQDALESQTDVRFKLDWRAKRPDRVLQKLLRKHVEDRSRFEDMTPTQVLDSVSDLAGVRVLTYVDADRSKVVEVLKTAFRGPEGNGVIGEEEKGEPGGYYRATHLDVALDGQQLPRDDRNIADTVCEIQVSSLLAHAANEIEHDLRYKPTTGELSADELELLDGLGALTVAGDKIINQLLQAVTRRQAESTGPFQDHHDFVVRMRKLVALPRLEVHATQLSAELGRLELNTPGKIKSELLKSGWKSEASTELERFNTYMAQKGYSDELLDPDTSDLLLVRLLQERLKDVLAGHPLGRGMGRPSRLVSVAKRYATFSK